jgi:hypothetical protein
MHHQPDVPIDIVDKLQETHQAAQKTNDSLLVYLVERALSHARGMVAENAPPSNSGSEPPDRHGFILRVPNRAAD